MLEHEIHEDLRGDGRGGPRDTVPAERRERGGPDGRRRDVVESLHSTGQRPFLELPHDQRDRRRQQVRVHLPFLNVVW